MCAEGWHGSGQVTGFPKWPGRPSLTTHHITALLDGVNGTLSLVSLSNKILDLKVHKPCQYSSYHLPSGPCLSVGVCCGAACLYRQRSHLKGQNPIYRPDLPFHSWTDEGRFLSVLSEIIWGSLLCSKNSNKRQDAYISQIFAGASWKPGLQLTHTHNTGHDFSGLLSGSRWPTTRSEGPGQGWRPQ